jgi:hypothetical protein
MLVLSADELNAPLDQHVECVRGRATFDQGVAGFEVHQS